MSTMRTSRPISLLLPVLLIALASPFLIAAGGGDKVWVCKYVATPDGLYLVPKPGTNPTQVSASSVGDGTFADAHESLIFDQELAPDCTAENPNPPPATTCVGAIAAVMVDDDSVVVTGGTVTGTPAVVLNGEPTTGVACGTYSYVASAPTGWQLNGVANQAATVANGQITTLTWTAQLIPAAPCDGTINAVMVDGNGDPVAGSLSASEGAPTVSLNGGATTVTCDPDDTDPTHTYTATAPSGWRLVSDTTNPQTAQIDEDGDTATLRWTVELIPAAPCDGTISAVMVDGNGDPVAGSLSASEGAPTVSLNGGATTVTCDPDDTDPTHTYTATAPSGWRLVSDTTNPQTAQIDEDGDTATLRWVAEPIVIDPVCTGDQTLVNGVCTDPDPDPVCTGDQTLVNGVCTDPTIEDEEEVVVVDEPVVDDRESSCAGTLQVRVEDLLGQEIRGAAVAVNGSTVHLSEGSLVTSALPCGSADVELVTVPDGYTFVRTELDATAFSAQSGHIKSQKVTAAVVHEATSNVVFVVDPLEVLNVEYPEPPVREPSDSPEPAPAGPDSPLPAPQQPVAVPVSEPTLPRTGASAGRLLALGVLLVTAGGATLGSRRRIDS